MDNSELCKNGDIGLKGTILRVKYLLKLLMLVLIRTKAL